MAEVHIRAEEPRDYEHVFEIHAAAFPGPEEARLVERLRTTASPLVSLVAEAAVGELLGHILFSPVEVVSRVAGGERRHAMALAPVGVDPASQQAGVGFALCRAGLAACLAIGQPVVFVLGHSTYYPRFGFEPARPHGLFYKHEGFDGSFFVAELSPGALYGFEGEVVYLPAFDEV